MIAMTATFNPDPTYMQAKAGKIADRADIMRVVGVIAMSSMQGLLRENLAMTPDGGVRSGLLMGSLSVGHPDAFEEYSTDWVEVGTRVPYAAQVNYGGPIPNPGSPHSKATGKMLAIPVDERLRKDRRWPSDIDPGRNLLVLVRDEDSDQARLIDPDGLTPFGKKGEATTLFILKRSVEQDGKNFARWTEQARRDVATVWREHLSGRE